MFSKFGKNNIVPKKEKDENKNHVTQVSLQDSNIADSSRNILKNETDNAYSKSNSQHGDADGNDDPKNQLELEEIL